MSRRNEHGFALITVLGVVLIVSAVALTIASSMRVEALQVMGERRALELDELASGGQEIAAYLAARRLGTLDEDLADLPVEIVQPAVHYIVHFPTGDADVYLEAEDGKLNLSSAPEVLLEGTLAQWSGDPAKARMVMEAVKDWRDPDDEQQPNGAEKAYYAASNYAPRNGALGVADVGLLRGMTADDFRERLLSGVSGERYRSSLLHFLTDSPVGATVNPNFASETVLRAVPGLADVQVRRIISERRDLLFRNVQDFLQRAGIPENAPSLGFFHFVRRVPATTVIARSADQSVVRVDRRINQPLSRSDSRTGRIEFDRVVSRVDRDQLPDFAAR